VTFFYAKLLFLLSLPSMQARKKRKLNRGVAEMSSKEANRYHKALQKIPSGHVVTFSTLAELAGVSLGARSASTEIHKIPTSERDLPWWRVVYSGGKNDEKPLRSILQNRKGVHRTRTQAKLLASEGIDLDSKLDKNFTICSEENKKAIVREKFPVNKVFEEVRSNIVLQSFIIPNICELSGDGWPLEKLMDVSICSAGKTNSCFYIKNLSGNVTGVAPNHKDFFLKVNLHPNSVFNLQHERDSLKLLKRTGVFRVPEVLTIGSLVTEKGNFLLLEFVGMSLGASQEAKIRAVARSLARLHSFSASDLFVSPPPLKPFGYFNYGNESETCWWGTTGWCSSWAEYFQQHRMDFVINRFKALDLVEENYELYSSLCMLRDLVPAFFVGLDITPALLHGDFHLGNVGFLTDSSSVEEDKVVGFDAMVCFGHTEIELAILCVHEKKGMDVFLDEYHKIIPPEEGFEIRKQLYTMFHVCNMFCQFKQEIVKMRGLELARSLLHHCWENDLSKQYPIESLIPTHKIAGGKRQKKIDTKGKDREGDEMETEVLELETVKNIVLVYCGAFAPVHKNHLALLDEAKAFLEREGYCVIAAYASAVNDSLVSTKLKRKHIPLYHRQKMVEIGSTGKFWMCDKSSLKPVELILNVQNVVAKHFPNPFRIGVVCGGDQCEGTNKRVAEQHLIICMIRNNYEQALNSYLENCPNRERIIVVEECNSVTRSSTVIRALITEEDGINKNRKQLEYHLPPEILKYIEDHNIRNYLV